MRKKSKKNKSRKLFSENKPAIQIKDLINKFLFLLFIFCLPFQLGKHFFFPFSYISGVRIDYLSPTLYFIDLIILILLVFNLKTVSNFFSEKIPKIFYSFLAVNLLFSKSTALGLYGIIRVFEFLIIFSLASKIYKILKARQIALMLLLGGLLELGLGITQISTGRSLQGIFYYLGERLFNLGMPGIASLSLQGGEYLRPYGTFSHPNSLGGFYLLLYFFILTNRQLNKYIYLKFFSLFVFSALVFISFSKIAIFAYLIFNLYYLYVSRKDCKICNVAKLAGYAILSLIVFSAQTDPMTIQKRLELLKNSVEIILKNPIFGVGLNNYLIAQSTFSSKFLLLSNQPVHNIFLLALSEVGIIFSGLFIYWIFRKFIKTGLTKLQIIIFGVIFLTGFFDHYWLTLVQNFYLMALILSISFQEGT